jgi:hypothetical protein
MRGGGRSAIWRWQTLASFEFTLELNRDLIEPEAESIKSSCGDATIKMIPTGIGTGYTGTLVEFDREAESLEKAIESAIADVETVADLRATGITIPAPERTGESSADEPGATAEPGAKAEKKPTARKASAKKPSPKKTGTRKAAAGE